MMPVRLLGTGAVAVVSGMGGGKLGVAGFAFEHGFDERVEVAVHDG